MPDIKVSGMYKEYYELLNKKVKISPQYNSEFQIKKTRDDKQRQDVLSV